MSRRQDFRRLAFVAAALLLLKVGVARAADPHEEDLPRAEVVDLTDWEEGHSPKPEALAKFERAHALCAASKIVKAGAAVSGMARISLLPIHAMGAANEDRSPALAKPELGRKDDERIMGLLPCDYEEFAALACGRESRDIVETFTTRWKKYDIDPFHPKIVKTADGEDQKLHMMDFQMAIRLPLGRKYIEYNEPVEGSLWRHIEASYKLKLEKDAAKFTIRHIGSDAGPDIEYTVGAADADGKRHITALTITHKKHSYELCPATK